MINFNKTMNITTYTINNKCKLNNGQKHVKNMNSKKQKIHYHEEILEGNINKIKKRISNLYVVF